MNAAAERNRARSRALQHAYTALAKAHPAEFEQLLNIERAKEGLPPVGELVGEVGAPAANRSKTHCPANHDYETHGATYVDADGYEHRQCRACQREKARLRALAKKSGALAPESVTAPASGASVAARQGVNGAVSSPKAAAAPAEVAHPAGATAGEPNNQPALAGPTRS